MKISILTPDFSHNCFGRAWLLANILKDNYDIEVIGPAYGNAIWKPLKDQCDFETKIVNGYENGQFEFKKLLRKISGDVVYASKPLIASYGVGLIKKYTFQRPLVLDIDDSEIGYGKKFLKKLIWPKKILDIILSIPNVRSYLYIFLANKLYWLADSITVSGKTLQKTYGGTVIWHGRDCKLIDPERFKKDELKRKIIPNVDKNFFIVGFIGTPRPHKGIEDLIDAISQIKNQDIILIIVGANNENYSKNLKEKIKKLRCSNQIIVYPEQNFNKIFEFLSIIDLVVVPQRKDEIAHGQVPAKIFDAMAMAKPIISTNVYDIPEILQDCGWIIEPENGKELIKRIKYAYCNQEKTKALGIKAREKCEKNYSWEVIGKSLVQIFEDIRVKKLS